MNVDQALAALSFWTSNLYRAPTLQECRDFYNQICRNSPADNWLCEASGVLRHDTKEALFTLIQWHEGCAKPAPPPPSSSQAVATSALSSAPPPPPEMTMDAFKRSLGGSSGDDRAAFKRLRRKAHLRSLNASQTTSIHESEGKPAYTNFEYGKCVGAITGIGILGVLALGECKGAAAGGMAGLVVGGIACLNPDAYKRELPAKLPATPQAAEPIPGVPAAEPYTSFAGRDLSSNAEAKG